MSKYQQAIYLFMSKEPNKEFTFEEIVQGINMNSFHIKKNLLILVRNQILTRIAVTNINGSPEDCLWKIKE